MVRLYLDLETYRPRKEGSFVEERIISSGLVLGVISDALVNSIFTSGSRIITFLIERKL